MLSPVIPGAGQAGTDCGSSEYKIYEKKIRKMTAKSIPIGKFDFLANICLYPCG